MSLLQRSLDPEKMLGLVDVLYTAVFDLSRWKEGRLVDLSAAAIGTELALHNTPHSGEKDCEKLHLVAQATYTMNQNFWAAAFDMRGKPRWGCCFVFCIHILASYFSLYASEKSALARCFEVEWVGVDREKSRGKMM